MAPASAPPQLLLVADDELWRRELREVLQQEGFRVFDIAYSVRLRDLLNPPSGRQAFQLLVINIPGASVSLPAAVQLIQALRRRDSATPLLLIPDQADEEVRVRLLEAGADDVLTRGFGLREFIARSRALMRRSRRRQLSRSIPTGQDLLRLGELCLHRSECRASLAGEDLHLSPKEFRLLECFMLQPGRALSREQLLEQVWGPDFTGDSKSVDVHVLWLRRKIEPQNVKPQWLVTVRGVGYRLDGPSQQGQSKG
jgi:two-component system phosphate regulon response regulator PhoB